MESHKRQKSLLIDGKRISSISKDTSSVAITATSSGTSGSPEKKYKSWQAKGGTLMADMLTAAGMNRFFIFYNRCKSYYYNGFT